MENEKAMTMQEVSSTFASWKAVSDQIASVQAALSNHDPDRHAPVDELQVELRVLHTESEHLLLMAQNALFKIKTPRSSNGDSTWA